MAESQYQQEACMLDYTPVAALTAGDVIQISDGRAAIPSADIAAGALGSVQVGGIYKNVTKAASQVWIDGAPIWWDHSANAATCIPRMGAGDRDFYLGTAVGDVASATVLGTVNLNVQPVYEIDLARDAFDPIVVKTVVGSTTVEVPHVEPRGGGIAMIFGTTAEAQKVDLLSERSFALASNWIVEGEINIVANADASAGDINIGVANGTHATDADSITEHLFLHIDGASANINAQSKDGTTTVTATDTTVDFTAGTPFHFCMDGRNPADVQVYINGVLMLTATVFDISAATGPLKLLAHMEKTSDDTAGTVQVNKLRVRTAQQ